MTLVVPFTAQRERSPNSGDDLGLADRAADMFKRELVALIPRLRVHALSLTRSSAEADDLVQDALVRALRFRESFQPGGNLSAWMNKILRNTFYTAVKARRNTLQDVDGRHAAQLRCEPDQEWRIKHGELLNALGRLNEQTRDALLLIVAEGLSYEEAADISACAVGTMKSRVNRGRRQLAELMGMERATPGQRPPRAAFQAGVHVIPSAAPAEWVAVANAA